MYNVGLRKDYNNNNNNRNFLIYTIVNSPSKLRFEANLFRECQSAKQSKAREDI